MDVKKVSIYKNNIYNNIDKIELIDTNDKKHIFPNLTTLYISTRQITKITDNKYQLNIDDVEFDLLNNSINFIYYFTQNRPIIFKFVGSFILQTLEINYISYYKGNDAYTNGTIYKMDGVYKYIAPYWHKNEDNSISLIIEIEDITASGGTVDLTEVNNKIFSLETRLNDIATDVNKISTIETDINNIQTKLETIENRLTIINDNLGNAVLNKQVTQAEYDAMKANGELQDNVMYIII